MDRILDSYLNDFKLEFGYENIDNSKLFEHFVNYCLVTKICNDRASVEKINVGGSRNPGIDGLAIMVNDNLVISSDEVEYFIEENKTIDVEFIFIQTKTSGKFSMKDISSFFMSVKSFFSDEKLDFEDYVRDLIDVKDHIYKQVRKLYDAPKLKLYYATTGEWVSNRNLEVAVKTGIDELNAGGLFSNVRFYPIDAEKTKRIYKQINNTITKEVEFDKHTILPKIKNVQESYLGILPIKEFLKFIIDDDGDLIKNVFYDNVRDFQGFNKINNEIRGSVSNESARDQFVLRNNGITIVAKSLKKIGSSFIITDYQIVNGCQTSHVLYFNKNLHRNNVIQIPVKLIITNDESVTNYIIRATNSQTEVKREAFEILKPFHKGLEEFYLTFERDVNKRLFYERRSRQFKQFSDILITRDNVITLATQIASFVAMFLDEPQSTHRYFGELLKSYHRRIFVENHSYFPYYTSGLACSAIDRFYKSDVLNNKYRKYKYHMLLMFRIRVAGEKKPILIQNDKIDNYCLTICENLRDREIAKQIFLEVEKELISKLNSNNFEKRTAHSIKAFTKILLPSVSSNRKFGRITYYDPVRSFAFIRVHNTVNDVYVREREIKSVYKGTIKPNLKFEFDIYDSEPRSLAKNLEFIE